MGRPTHPTHPSPYLRSHEAGWLAETRMFSEHVGAVCSGRPGCALAETQQMLPLAQPPPQVPQAWLEGGAGGCTWLQGSLMIQIKMGTVWKVRRKPEQ